MTDGEISQGHLTRADLLRRAAVGGAGDMSSAAGGAVRMVCLQYAQAVLPADPASCFLSLTATFDAREEIAREARAGLFRQVNSSGKNCHYNRVRGGW